MMRWGFPPPPKLGPQPVTNVRNVASLHLAVLATLAEAGVPLSRAGLVLQRVCRHQAAEDAGLVCSQ